MIQTTPEVIELRERLLAVTGPVAFPNGAFVLAMKHLPDQRTILHSFRVATRSVKRYAGDDDARHTFAAVGLLHDVLEDSPDPLGAAMEVAHYFEDDAEAAEAVLLLTRTTKDTDATYFERMTRGGNMVAFRVKIEDSIDNLRDAKGVFTDTRMARFAVKTALYVMPLVRLYAPKMVPVMEQELLKAVAK